MLAERVTNLLSVCFARMSFLQRRHFSNLLVFAYLASTAAETEMPTADLVLVGVKLVSSMIQELYNPDLTQILVSP